MKIIQVNKYLAESHEVASQTNFKDLIKIENLMKSYLDTSKSIFVCGNGGSANCASHFVTDLSKMLHLITNQTLKIYCLNDNLGAITAYSNDISYDDVYSMQLKNYASKGDMLILVSGSGNSPNVCAALDFANKHNVNTISFTGFDGGYLKNHSEFNFHIPSNNMQIVEDHHVQAMHILMRSLTNQL